MPAQLLALDAIALTFGGTPLLTGAGLSVLPGDRIALVGRNGSGKSTLLRIAAAEIEPDAGTVFIQPGATVRYLPQEPDLSGFADVAAYVAAGLTEGDDPYRAQYLIEHVGLTGQEAPAHLSGGEARRAALARVLAPEPDLLLLDEPTNHLDLPAIEWLEGELAAMKSAIVLISHDRRFLTNLSRKTVWLDRGETRQLNEGFAGFEAWRDRLLDEEADARHKLDRKIVREEHWLRYGVTARRKRNVRRLSDLAALRDRRRNQSGPQGNVTFAASEARSSGLIVADAEHLGKTYDGRPIVTDLSLRILRGDRLAIVGPNGAGKTTIVRLLTGELAPDTGTIRLGTNLETAILDQRRDRLDPNLSLKDALTGGGTDWLEIGGQRRHVTAYMKDFLFAPEQAGTALSRLSGGERARVALARALSLPSNLLVLDEPTNDLDLETLDLLQEMIADYAGTVILVSHDRDFVDRIASSVLTLEGEGRWVEYAGGYADMLAQRGRTPADAPAARQAVRSTAKSTAAKPAPAQPAQPAMDKKRKLSFNEQHALKTLPAAIARIQADIAAAEAKLADPDLFARDPDAFHIISKKLEQLQSDLGAAEDRWLELELLREELGQ